MKDNVQYIISIDPGISGGISVIDIKTNKLLLYQKNPVKKNDNNHKKSYDLDGFKEIFANYKNAYLITELVHSMPREGSSSSFNFGRSSGQIEGLAKGMEIHYQHITPQKWKNYYKEELISDEMRELKEEISQLKKDSKEIKDKTKKTTNKKEITKLNNQYKKLSKDQARLFAVSIFPETEDMLSKATYDGVAESILIGQYFKDNIL